MGRISMLFIVIGLILIICMMHNLTLYQKRRIYPPKKMIRKRILFLGGEEYFVLY
ncbi:hypothetical protein [Heyndrickxia ginsengihumi]|uniref:hypothetical protein n=1 Tax=Heyndrickxia ginsengihumi TaxID=363870 RepID=UPI000A80C21C|nr:hypothetical protein [Heyndrickxia ginsengihumi]